MNEFHVQYSAAAQKVIKKLDPSVARMIVSWIRKNLEGCADPRVHGKGLSGDRAGHWRYRVGDYRLLAEIQDEKIIILLLNIGHRSKIYDEP